MSQPDLMGIAVMRSEQCMIMDKTFSDIIKCVKIMQEDKTKVDEQLEELKDLITNCLTKCKELENSFNKDTSEDELIKHVESKIVELIQQNGLEQENEDES